eukprot:3396015-Rhodomonas_salina.1
MVLQHLTVASVSQVLQHDTQHISTIRPMVLHVERSRGLGVASVPQGQWCYAKRGLGAYQWRSASDGQSAPLRPEEAQRRGAAK